MRVNLLRVGADQSYGGCWSPINPDLSFCFVPIPGSDAEKYGVSKKLYRYDSIMCRDKKVFDQIPAELKAHLVNNFEFAHNDPEFIGFTYGSPRQIKKKDGSLVTEKNYTGLCGLEKGDLVVFYAGFECTSSNTGKSGLFILGFLYVDSVIPYSKLTDLTPEQSKLVKNNPHYFSKYEDQVIVVGSKMKSKLLKKAIPLSIRGVDNDKAQYYPSKEIIKDLGGYDKALNKSSLRKLGEVPLYSKLLKL